VDSFVRRVVEAVPEGAPRSGEAEAKRRTKEIMLRFQGSGLGGIFALGSFLSLGVCDRCIF